MRIEPLVVFYANDSYNNGGIFRTATATTTLNRRRADPRMYVNGIRSIVVVVVVVSIGIIFLPWLVSCDPSWNLMMNFKSDL